MSTVVQPCARCGARWSVQGAPMHWCPRCRGVLLSPAPIDAPAERRNYRWVARVPEHRTHHARVPVRPATGARPPRYTSIPRWGLHDPRPQAAVAPRQPLSALTGSVTGLLVTTAVLFALAALAEVGRYLVLLRNRTRLIPSAVLYTSDAFVIGAGVLALVFALVAAVAVLGKLIEIRRAAYAEAGRRDPRSPRALAFGCLVPVVNLLWPMVFLSEVAALRDDPRSRRAIRIWWAAWLFGGGMAVAGLLWRTADSLQAEADGVLFTALIDVVAATVALSTLWTLRTIEGRDLRGRRRIEHRWLIAVDPIVPVIEPVHPGDHDRTAGPVLAEAPATPATETGVENREQEEVMAK
ncbi:DUF4328 domain-containing protein [Nocardia sp. 004]|uniref:DUF4328 domain-containing protein n=1 Tax=Nocardia sp. 004 TaxID=3385978 RepID=UPI0039A26D9A